MSYHENKSGGCKFIERQTKEVILNVFKYFCEEEDSDGNEHI